MNTKDVLMGTKLRCELSLEFYHRDRWGQIGIRSMVSCLFLTSKDPTKFWRLSGKHNSVPHRNQQIPEACYFTGINLPPFPQILFQKEYERKSMSGNRDFPAFYAGKPHIEI